MGDFTEYAVYFVEELVRLVGQVAVGAELNVLDDFLELFLEHRWLREQRRIHRQQIERDAFRLERVERDGEHVILHIADVTEKETNNVLE